MVWLWDTEDINDHEQLRTDPLRHPGGPGGAGAAITSGQEHAEPDGTAAQARSDRYKKITFWKNWIDELFVKIFVESYQTAPDEIILDDTTDLPLHGKQEGRFFHGYYDNYCYLPLYIFSAGEQILCSARLREANHDASFGSLAEIQRIVTQIREAWPKVKNHSARRLRVLP